MPVKGYVVSGYTESPNPLGGAGLGNVSPKTHTGAEAAAKDLLIRDQQARLTVEINRAQSGEGLKRGVLWTEVRVLDEKGMIRSFTGSEAADFRKAIKTVSDSPDYARSLAQETRGLAEHLKGLKGAAKMAVPAAALVAGAAAQAQEPGATPKSIAAAGLNSAVNSVPGVEAYRKGDMCRAFGEASGAVAGSATYGAGMAMTGTAAVIAATGTGAVSMGTASIPSAMLITAGGIYATDKAAKGVEAGVAGGAESACRSILEGGILLRQKSTEMMDSISTRATEMARAVTSPGYPKTEM